MQTLRSIRTIVDVNTAVVASLGVLATWACDTYGLSADFPLTLIATDVARECLDETLKEARAGLQRRLSDRFEDELRTLIERALRSHLQGDG